MQFKFLAIAMAAGLLMAGAAQGATVKFSAALKGSEEVPSNTTPGAGKVTASLDTVTKAFTYEVNYSGLTGPAVAAHFHGPALPGANAGPVVPVVNLANPMKGSATLTDPQIADLTAGNWYFNIHTAAHPGGEIRGQLVKAP